MPTYTHSLGEVLSQLNTKISALEAKKTEIEVALGGKVSAVNVVALQKITESLSAAQVARDSLQLSCCTGQTCNFDWET